jgi:WD40 repeat protein
MWHSGFIYSAQFSKDNAHVLTSSGDGRARLWRVEDGKLEVTYENREEQIRQNGVTSAKFSCDETMVLTSGDDGSARLWDRTTGTLLNVFGGHTAAVWASIFTRDCAQIITGSSDETIRFWQIDVGVAKMSWITSGNTMWGADISPDGSRVAVSMSEDKARLFNTVTNQTIELSSQNKGNATTPLFSPDGKVFVTNGKSGALIWDSKDGTLKRILPASTQVRTTAFSSDGRNLALIEDRTITIWNLYSSESPKQFPNGASSLPSKSSFLSQNTRLVVCCDDTGRSYLYDASTGDRLAVFAASPVKVAEIRASDGEAQQQTFVDMVGFNTVELRDAHNGNLLQTIVPADPEREVSSARLTSDGGLLVLGRNDGEVELWDVTKRRELMKFNVENRINDIAFESADGAEAISASPDGVIRLLDLKVGTIISVLRAHTGAAVQISTSRDGRFVLTQGYDHSVRLFAVPTVSKFSGSALIQTACRDLLLHTGNGGQDNFAKLTSQELAAVPAVDANRDYELEGDVCAPVSPWKRLFRALKGY